jgi:transposase
MGFSSVFIANLPQSISLKYRLLTLICTGKRLYFKYSLRVEKSKWSLVMAISEREQRGLAIAALCRIDKKDGVWHVPSQSGAGKYEVQHTAGECRCTCPDYELRKQKCKHIYAVEYTIEREVHGDGSETLTKTMTIVEKVTYKQDWPAYNEAQANEKDRFQVLLADLCSGVPEPDRSRIRGQKPHPVKDALFAMAFKVYSTFSSRRFSCDLRDAHEQGFTSGVIPGGKVNAFLESSEFTPILRQLIVRSALPLRTVEKDFAIDSSGFSSSRFERWFDHKYGVTRQKCVWVKVHVAVGVKTNVVTAVRILDKDAADCPQFVPLVKETRDSFTIGEVSADKAYASLENFEEVAGMGGTLFAAFKTNATGGIGGMFEKMFHYFQYRREEFLTHYHKRSNVESTFSAIKRKFGDSVRSKTDTAMTNEVLCKVLCHNICCVIQEQCELGIEPVFWGETARPSNAREITVASI